MPTIHFYGEVLPREALITVSNLPKIPWPLTKDGSALNFSVKIKQGKIHVAVETEHYSPRDILVLHMRAFDLARTAVELAAFKMGWGVTTTLSTFTDPDGVTFPVPITHDNLASLCTAFDLENGFSEIWRIVQGDIDIFGALNDLIASITLPHVGSVNCARAIEAIRKEIAGGGSSKKSAAQREWLKMEEALRIDRRYRESITKLSIVPRHGKRVRVDGPTTAQNIERSWTIMNRFLEYKKRADGPLPEEEFELLKG